jgi:Domain of unknown function (DUF4124)
MRILLFALLVFVPLLSHAQAYKCKQANGATSFQDEPCPVGVAAAKLALPSAPITLNPPPQSASTNGSFIPKTTKPSAASAPAMTRAEREQKEENERLQAASKAQRCSAARKQLAMLNEGGVLYRKDSEGKPQFLKAENRKSEIAGMEQRVASECS